MTAARSITEPGVYDMPNDVYHADPVPAGSLSASGAKKLLPPHCPAIYRWERDHPRESTAAFNFGHGAHQMVLGGGPEIVRIDADSWRTNKAKAQRDEVYARGGVPLLPEEYQQVQDMATALRLHPIASALFDPEAGQAEQSLFWVDEPSGIWRRSRLDWLPHATGQRMIIADYKTAVSADPEEFAHKAVGFGYHQQGAFYTDGAVALGLADDPAFVFVVQEKTAPYLVSVVELDRNAIRIGRILNREAINTYAECTSTDIWPGYTPDVALTSLPYWYERKFEDQL